MSQNHRRNERVACGAASGAEGPHGPVTGICRNISQGGMFFMGPMLPVGGSFEFWIQLPKGRIVTMGEVHYAHQYPEGHGIGVHFTRLTQDGVGLLNDFIAGAPETIRTTRRSD